MLHPLSSMKATHAGVQTHLDFACILTPQGAAPAASVAAGRGSTRTMAQLANLLGHDADEGLARPERKDPEDPGRVGASRASPNCSLPTARGPWTPTALTQART